MQENGQIGFNRVQQFMLTMAAFVVVVAGMRAAQDILIPFLLSLFIAIIVTPLLNWLRSKGMPTWAAILMIILAILVVGFLIAVLVGSSLTDFSNSLPSYQQSLQNKTTDLLTFFEEKGYNVLTANDGRGGITQFQHHPTDLVITDIVMPRIEGIATIREIRKQSKSVKIIAMTGYVDSYLKEAIILGADDSIVKPFNTEDLMAVVDRVMGSEA